MPVVRQALLTILIATLISGCSSYRSFVVADFHEYGYTNAFAHNEINLWWRSGLGFHSRTNPFFMVDSRKAEGGIVRLGFIRPMTRDLNAVITSLEITDQGNASVASNMITTPATLTFQSKEFSLFDDKHRNGRRVWRSYASCEFQPEVSISRSPYRIALSGYYTGTLGSREPFSASITMDLKRARSLGNIADSLP